MKVGIPREIMKNEKRVAATPQTVKQYIEKQGDAVFVQSGAGTGSNFSDADYETAGATILKDARELYERCDVILKVKEPLHNEETNQHELDMMREGQYLITFLHPASPGNHDMVDHMARRGVIGLTLDGVPRITRAQPLDALTSMSTCAGYKGVLMAADSLVKFMPQIFAPVGRIDPAKVLVVGTGVSGLQSIATAKRLGAVVHAADIRPDADEQARSLGAKTLDLGVPKEAAIGEGGYAKPLEESWLKHERDILAGHIGEYDIVVLSALVPGRMAPILVDEPMVKRMKTGSIVVDISVDQGGNCSLTETGEIINRHGVEIQGVKNIPGYLPESATKMFAQNVYNLFSYLHKDGGLHLDDNDEVCRSIIVTRGGDVVHEGTLEAMGRL